LDLAIDTEPHQPMLTRKGHWPRSSAILSMLGSTPIKVLVPAAKMPSPKVRGRTCNDANSSRLSELGQQHGRSQRGRDGTRRLGVLMGNRLNDPIGRALSAALVQELGTLGWREGDNLRIEWRWAGGDPALFQRYAAELAMLGPDAILAQTSPAVAALRRETNTIPLVFVTVTDPVGRGFVASMAHPGGTITGFSDFDPPMASKWLGMLTQITPPCARVAILYNPTTTSQAVLMLRAIEGVAPSFAVAVQATPVQDDSEIETTMAGSHAMSVAGCWSWRKSLPGCIATPSSPPPHGIACLRSTTIARLLQRAG
jgi:ABC transporter substrate binding protein